MNPPVATFPAGGTPNPFKRCLYYVTCDIGTQWASYVYRTTDSYDPGTQWTSYVSTSTGPLNVTTLAHSGPATSTADWLLRHWHTMDQPVPGADKLIIFMCRNVLKPSGPVQGLFIRLLSCCMFRRNRHRQGANTNIVKTCSNKIILQ